MLGDLKAQRSTGAGVFAERFVKLLSTPRFLLSQTLVIATWMALSLTHVLSFDPYPFILLNLALSCQAAYATPLILMGSAKQEREAVEREKQMIAGEDRIIELDERIVDVENRILERIEVLACGRCACAGTAGVSADTLPPSGD